MRDAYRVVLRTQKHNNMKPIEQRLQRNFIGGLISGMFNFAGSAASNAHLAYENEKNRDMQIQENQKDRDFNAEQSQISRDWQERMYQSYESPQAQAAQRMAAGLNPSEGVSSQSVGNSSTASSSSSALPPGRAMDFSAIADIPLIAAQLKNLKADTEKKKQEALTEKNRTTTEWFNSIIAETDANNRQAVIESQLALLKTQMDKGGFEAKEAQERYAMLKEFRDSGGNTFQDASDNTQSQTALNNFELSMRLKFDEKFNQLNYRAREREVQEFLDTSETRVSLQNAQVGFARLAMNEAERNEALNSIRNDISKYYASQILNAINEGKPLKGVMLELLTDNPAAAISAFSSLANFAPNITNKSTNNTTSVAYY